MTSLDTFIQEKQEEFDKKFPEQNVEHYIRGKRMDTFHVISTKKQLKDFLESTIRQTARETVEALKESIDKAAISEIPKFSTRQDARLATAMASEMKENCRTALLATAKEKGIM